MDYMEGLFLDMFYDFGISDDEFRFILEQVPNIRNMKELEINEKIGILSYVGCANRHIKNIIVSNPYYLERSNDDILRLIKYLRDIGISGLYLLFDMHPYLLNKDAFEIRNYVNDRINRGELLEDIVDDIESNPYIIEE